MSEPAETIEWTITCQADVLTPLEIGTDPKALDIHLRRAVMEDVDVVIQFTGLPVARARIVEDGRPEFIIAKPKAEVTIE